MRKNIVIRTVSGLLFIAIMAAGLLIDSLWYALLAMAITGIMTKEYFSIAVGKRHMVSQYAVMVAGWTLFILFYLSMRYSISTNWFLLLSLPITAAWVNLLYQKEDEAYNVAPWLFIPLIYIFLPFSLTNLLLFCQSGIFSGKLLLALFIILWASDVGAYIFGIGFGQKNGHKLFPRLSPKKSWEGFFGGLFTALIVSYILYLVCWLPFSWMHGLALAALLHIFGVWGDLVESQFKRHFGAKDSGTIMPGHGGLLDRFDSAVLAIPIAIVYFKLIIQ